MKQVACTLFLAVAFFSVAWCAEVPRHSYRDLPMTDGTTLATDVYLPATGDGPWPVILVRSTYGRRASYGEEYYENGIAVVIQDVRATGDSPGKPYLFTADGWRPKLHDGADTVDWVKAQPWCNGKIATVGGSALAITQALLAPATPHLTAQVLELAPTRFYDHIDYHGGVFRKNLVEEWLKMNGESEALADYKAHPFNDEFWTWYDPDARAGDINAPALFVNGWYDIFAQGTIDGFLAREKEGGAGARGNNYLIMRWSTHGSDVSTDYKFNENRFDLRVSHIRRKFLNYHLHGDKDALEGVPKVHYYVMGDDTDPDAPGNEWRTADTWPPVATVKTPLFLGARNSLSEVKPNKTGDPVQYLFDPNNPVPTRGGPNLFPDLPAGPFDQRALRESREDVIHFFSPSLESPLQITGQVTVMLYVSSDAPDTDYSVKLIDVFPDGREINVLDGIRRVKTRNGFDGPAPLLTGPDEVVSLEIDLWNTAWVFNAGHRIGLHISSSNYPRFEINPNTGADFPTEGEALRPATNAVHWGAETASALWLPVVE